MKDDSNSIVYLICVRERVLSGDLNCLVLMVC
jgi:hypothetical protein